MEVDIDLENLIKEVQRKLGRNVLLFQQTEYMLKYILAYRDVSVWDSGDGLKSNLEEQKQRFYRLSLGQIAKEFIGSTFSLESDSSGEEAELSGYRFFGRIKNNPVVCDIDFFNERKNELAALVVERNELIHHFLSKWNWEDYASLTEADKYLDQQRERVLPEFELLKSVVESFHSSREELVEYIRSDEFRNLLKLDYLRHSQHVAGLFEFATTKNRGDGWAMLSSAGTYLRKNISGDILTKESVRLKEEYGCKTLREIVQKSEYFDIREESTEKGGKRIIYRIRPDL